MGFFSNILEKLGMKEAAAAPVITPPPAAAPAAPAPVAAAPAEPVVQPIAMVDVVALLTEKAANHPEKLNWKTSIVDLLKLLGLDSTDVEQSGIDTEELPGFVINNGETEIKAHAQAVAAEMLSAFADNVMGRVAGILPDGVKMVGNMASTTINVAAAPSGKISALHEFPGQQKMVSRMAMLPEAARHLILGIIKVGV